MEYGQFCPIAKATEIVGEKWTLLIIRELLMGGSRFSELQRGLSLISPTILSKRLDGLIDHGLVMKKRIPGQRGYEYFPTKSCKELLPIVRSLGEWGMSWARSNLSERDYDVELLMLYLKRSIVPENSLAGRQSFASSLPISKNIPTGGWLLQKTRLISASRTQERKSMSISPRMSKPWRISGWGITRTEKPSETVCCKLLGKTCSHVMSPSG